MNERWVKFWNTISRQDGEAVFSELDRRYNESGRKYHGWEHISRSLDQLSLCRDYCRQPEALECAIWFHDAVYLPCSRENELQSAKLAEDLLKNPGVNEDFISLVHDLILATVPFSDIPRPLELLPDVEYMQDIDFAILGSEKKVFDAYEAGIREEYAMLDDESYRSGRVNFLSDLDRSSRIYRTDFFFKRYEEQARDNVRRSLRILEEQMSSRQAPVPEEQR